ncbi:hypothetical protein [Bradyrhizobium sp. SYSU BS000235]|uniref:hypothetical protein n=1 Tax=Bradyrhizobium sp. SYSU BS000235 TaxID=3411332 RepID=UPI003C725E4F
MANSNEPEVDGIEDRRKFLAACGKFAIVTPPAITLLLSTSLNSAAVAGSGGGWSRHDPGC